MKEKQQAMRTCVGTGKKFPKTDMIRFVCSKDGELKIDLRGKEKGRGANLSMSMEAFDMAVNKNSFQRNLKLKQRPKGNMDKLRKEFEQAIAEKKFRSGNRPVTIKVSKDELVKLSKSGSA